jgi:hypothetical protein
MHSNKVSVLIGSLFFVINVVLMIIYYHKQGTYTFEFVKNLYKWFSQ